MKLTPTVVKVVVVTVAVAVDVVVVVVVAVAVAVTVLIVVDVVVAEVVVVVDVVGSAAGQLRQSTKHTSETVHPAREIGSLHLISGAEHGAGGSARPLQLTEKSSVVLVEVLVLVVLLVDVLVLVEVVEVMVVSVVLVVVLVVPVVAVVADVAVVVVTVAVVVVVVLDVVSGHLLSHSSGQRSSTSMVGAPGMTSIACPHRSFNTVFVAAQNA